MVNKKVNRVNYGKGGKSVKCGIERSVLHYLWRIMEISEEGGDER
jgi:hypothetical protein